MKHNRLDAEEIWPGRDLYRAIITTCVLEPQQETIRMMQTEKRTANSKLNSIHKHKKGPENNSNK
jgi:hypothetical protein